MQLETMERPTEIATVQQAPQLPESLTNVSEYQLRLRDDPNVRALTDKIDINDSNTIVVFGSEPSTELSKISDQLLNSLKVARSDEASEMLTALTKIMDKFDETAHDLEEGWISCDDIIEIMEDECGMKYSVPDEIRELSVKTKEIKSAELAE